VVVDGDSNGSVSNERTTNQFILQVTTMPQGYDLMHPGKGHEMMFQVWGQAVGVGQRFVITNSNDGVGGAATTTVCINAGGRIRSLKDDVTCP
jgi:hypothetical protein